MTSPFDDRVCAMVVTNDDLIHKVEGWRNQEVFAVRQILFRNLVG